MVKVVAIELRFPGVTNRFARTFLPTVGVPGLEPGTSSSRTMRATNCAIPRRWGELFSYFIGRGRGLCPIVSRESAPHPRNSNVIQIIKIELS